MRRFLLTSDMMNILSLIYSNVCRTKILFKNSNRAHIMVLKYIFLAHILINKYENFMSIASEIDKTRAIRIKKIHSMSQLK